MRNAFTMLRCASFDHTRNAAGFTAAPGAEPPLRAAGAGELTLGPRSSAVLVATAERTGK